MKRKRLMASAGKIKYKKKEGIQKGKKPSMIINGIRRKYSFTPYCDENVISNLNSGHGYFLSFFPPSTANFLVVEM